MKQILLLFGILFSAVFSQAQTNNIDSLSPEFSVKSSAQKMGQYFIDKNYVQYVKYVHPKIMKLAGGQTKMIELLKKSLKQTEDQGFTFQNVSIGEPSKIITKNTELQSVVPQILELKTKDGKIVATSYLLALSTDKGKTWYFIDTSGKTLAQMKSTFPSLSNELIIPDKEQPKFYRQ